MDEFFEDIKFLASFVGCNIFEIIKFTNEHIFYTNGRGCNAMGFYNSSGFTVLKGSIIASTSPRLSNGGIKDKIGSRSIRPLTTDD